ncbi:MULTISPECIES: tetratricopeptide repeat protein [unclassified Saccharothrix]|uniref:tetratricopeptide repeat protein n=1 Tax=unclassified Saccharothrix TaxID=2593673 RepID=UPI00307FADFE
MTNGDQVGGGAGPTGHQSAEASSSGVVVQAGRDVVIGEVNLRTGVPVRTRYRHQVMRIAPAVLVGRDAELAELAAFCTSDSSQTYQWWRAGAWAGKSALFSTFVLNPPPGVRVVSFFVTARLAGQADRVAFVDNVLEQVLALLGEQAPALLTPSTREAHVLGLLEEAARLCRERGETLVLLVDGLDEDRGVTTGPDSHSIAALLPTRPVDGLRVVVSGRPDPPIPGDVPEDHPLRDESVVRALEVSPQARALRAEMERDLKRLVGGSRVEQDVLGLLVAAGGGLTSRDLAGLSGAGEWEVRDHLTTVTGRSFTRRDGDLGADVYLLAHEELQVTALDMLGGTRLSAYRDRIHEWAASHGDWPPDTPDYLLRGYHTMLLATGDLTRATALSTDLSRHDRLFDRTGGDDTALAQLTATLDAHVATDPPDLPAVSRLAVHRDHLVDRNTHIPPEVPALWLRLGHPRRAVALARSISDPHRRASALVPVAAALAEAGRNDEARELLDEAMRTTDRITHHDHRNSVLASVAATLAETGDHNRAIEIARSITSADRRAPALASIALGGGVPQSLAAVLAEGSVRTARSIVDPHLRCVTLASVAELVAAGGLSGADELIDEVSEASRRTSEPTRLGKMRVALVRALAAAGHHDRATEVAASIDPDHLRVSALSAVAARLLEAGQPAAHVVEQVVRAAQAVQSAEQRCHALSAAATSVCGRGNSSLAKVLVDEAIQSARSIGDPERRSRALAAAVAPLVDLGDHDRAGEIRDEAVHMARSITDPDRLNSVLVPLAKAQAAAGHADEAIAAARAITDVEEQNSALTVVAIALVAADLPDQALTAAGAITDVDWRGETLTSLAGPLAAAGHHDHAVTAAEAATDPADRHTSLVSIAEALIDAGQPDRAAQFLDGTLRAMGSLDVFEANAVVSFATTFVRAGRADRADELLEEAARAAEDSPHIRDDVLTEMAEVLARAGLHDRAISAAGAITDHGTRAAGLLWTAAAMAAGGHPDEAHSLIAEARRIESRPATPTRDVDVAIVAVTAALVSAGRPHDAIAMARSIQDRRRRNDELAEIARKLAGTDHPAVAIDAVREIADAVDRRLALESIATVMAEHGHHEEALSAARMLDVLEGYGRTLVAIAAATAGLGHHEQAGAVVDEALSVVAKVEYTGARDRVMVRAAAVLAVIGRHRQAAEIVRRIPDFHRWEPELASVATALVKADRFDEAAGLISTIPESVVPDRDRVEVVGALADAGEYERAEVVLGWVVDAQTRASALMGLAGRSGATRYAAEALRAAQWTTALEGLCAVSTAAASAIQRELELIGTLESTVD